MDSSIRLAQQIEVAQDAFLLLDDRFQVVYLNRKGSELLRRPVTAVKGKLICDLLREMVGPEIAARMHGPMRQRTPHRFEAYSARTDAWYEFQVNPGPGGVGVWFSDVTERKRLQEKAERAAATLDVIMKFVPEGLMIVSSSLDRIQCISRYSSELSRRSCGDLVGKPVVAYEDAWHIFRLDGSKPDPRELPITRAINGELVVCEEWLLERGDGVRINVLCNAAPTVDSAGRIIGCILVWRDITARKAAQERWMESRKLAAIGALAGGFAHNLNNLLTAIEGNISLVLDQLESDEPNRKLLTSAMTAAETAARMTARVLAFAGKSAFTSVEKFDLSIQIRNCEGLIRAMVPPHIKLALDLTADLPEIEGDRAQLQQALFSLLENAIEAVGQTPGSIGIRTRPVDLGKSELEHLPNGPALQPGRYVALELSDSGKGIEPQYRDRIFDPFFSTKFLGRGLGLAAVYGVMRSHNGTVDVSSHPGEGSEFRLCFPAAA